MFADRAKIIIRSGKGGDGHVSFRRELYVPTAVRMAGTAEEAETLSLKWTRDRTLWEITGIKRKFKAEDGEEGGKRRCHGGDGRDIVLKVPEGTVIMEAESRKVIADMSGDNKRQVVLKGGRAEKAISIMQLPPCRCRNMPSRDSLLRSWRFFWN